MKIKRKKLERLNAELLAYKKILSGTRLIIEVPGKLGPEAGPLDIPPMIPVMDVTLEHAAIIAKFGGYDNHVGEVLNGPFAIRFVTNDPASGYEHFLYHCYTQDGRSVITQEARSETPS